MFFQNLFQQSAKIGGKQICRDFYFYDMIKLRISAFQQRKPIEQIFYEPRATASQTKGLHMLPPVSRGLKHSVILWSTFLKISLELKLEIIFWLHIWIPLQILRNFHVGTYQAIYFVSKVTVYNSNLVYIQIWQITRRRREAENDRFSIVFSF